MATRTTGQEWEHAVIGTVLSVSLGGVLLGLFQLAEGESIGTIPLFLGGIGLGLLLYRSKHRLQWAFWEQIDSFTTLFENDSQLVFQERHARGDDAAFDRRRSAQDVKTTERNETDESTTEQRLVSERK